MSPSEGEGGEGGVAGSQPMRTAVHRSPNKLWRSNIFIIWMARKSDFDVPDPLSAVLIITYAGRLID